MFVSAAANTASAEFALTVTDLNSSPKIAVRAGIIKGNTSSYKPVDTFIEVNPL